MSIILGIETSCDETAAAVYDSEKRIVISSALFSQVLLHEKYGGVVPEIASRSHLEKIGLIVREALAGMHVNDIDYIAVTNKPGLVGALLIGLSFAKGLAFAHNKNLIGVDHIESHIFSSFLSSDGTVRDDIPFPHICLVASGGHTSLFFVKDFGSYTQIGQTLDDAAGEAFDKVAKLIELGYPGGPRIEALAKDVGYKDFFHYPRTKSVKKSLDFSFSGLKTAVLYDLVARGAYDLHNGVIVEKMTDLLKKQVASSLLVCIAEIAVSKIELALDTYPEAKGVTFAGGVACNYYLRTEIQKSCERRKKIFVVPPSKYCGDNAAMVAFVGGYKSIQGKISDYSLDVLE